LRTSPLAAIFYLGRIFEAIAKNAVQSLAPLVAYLIATEGSIATRIGFGLAAFFSIILLSSVVRYWFFRYRITSDSVLIREGVFRKTQLDIKFDRIQAINTEQNIIYRYFGLVTVKFDTAGSTKQEGSLPAVRSELADSLKERIRRARPATAMTDESEPGDEAPVRTILTLTHKDMVRIGLSSNRALFFLVLLGPLIDQLESRIDELIEGGALNLFTGGVEVTLLSGTIIAIAALLAFLLLLMVVSILGAFLRYFGFELIADNDVLRSSGGLLTRHEHSINLAKIQTLEARQNPLLLLFNRYRMRAKQASSSKAGRKKSFVIPLCTDAQLPVLDKEIFGAEYPEVDMRPRSDVFRPVSSRYVRSRLLYMAVLPTVIMLGPLLILMGSAALGLLLWIPVCTLCVWTMYKKYGYFPGNNGLVLRRGLIGFRTDAFLYRKVQRIGITQTPLQKRKALATMRFYMASGTLKLPYVDDQFARQLRDYVLYKVESSNLAWH